MSYNGSGTFNINSAGQPVVTGTVISSTAFNALTADLGTGLSTAITKDGQTVATARIPFAAGINSSLVTDATSTTTGSIITAGGVGIAKAVFVGTTLNVAGASTLAGITGSFNGTVGATTPAAGSFTTLSASGVAALSRGVYRDIVGGGAMAIYDNSVIASGTNYVVASDGAATSINGTTTVKTRVSGAEVSSVSSTGLAVTGTLSATGTSTLAGVTATKSSGTVAAFTQTGATGYGLIIVPGADTVYDALGINNAANTLNMIRMFGNGTATFAGGVGIGGAASPGSTGLAVTGTLSATGLITSTVGNNLQFFKNEGNATTGYMFSRILNTSGGLILGTEGSAGGQLITGSSSYDAVVRGVSGLAFSANDGAAMQMRLSSTGLAVTGGISATNDADIGATGSAASKFLNIRTGTNLISGLRLFAGAGATLRAQLSYDDNTGATTLSSPSSQLVNLALSTGSISGAGTISGGTSGTGYSFSGGAPATSLTLDSSGNLIIGVAGSGTLGRLTVRKDTGIPLAVANEGVTGTLIDFQGNGSGSRGSITHNGTSVAYNTTSDYRLKENVQPMKGALATVTALKPVTFNWKSDGSDGQGFIAHELQAVVPDCVTGEKDATEMQTYEISPAIPATKDEEGNELTAAIEAVMGEREVPRYQGIDTSFLVATLTAAIQELKAIVDAQATRIAALEAK